MWTPFLSVEDTSYSNFQIPNHSMIGGFFNKPSAQVEAKVSPAKPPTNPPKPPDPKPPDLRSPRNYVLSDLFRAMPRLIDPCSIVVQLSSACNTGLKLPMKPDIQRSHILLLLSEIDKGFESFFGSVRFCKIFAVEKLTCSVVISFQSESINSQTCSRLSKHSVNYHKAAVLSSCVIISPVETNIPLDNLKQHLSQHGVKDAKISRWFYPPVNGSSSGAPRRSVCVSLPSSSLPSLAACPSLDNPFARFSLKMFSFPKRVCSKCWCLGHSASHCSAPHPKCGFCGLDHMSSTCPVKNDQSKQNCLLCKKSHAAHRCPLYRGVLSNFELKSTEEASSSSPSSSPPPINNSFPPLPNSSGWSKQISSNLQPVLSHISNQLDVVVNSLHVISEHIAKVFSSSLLSPALEPQLIRIQHALSSFNDALNCSLPVHSPLRKKPTPAPRVPEHSANSSSSQGSFSVSLCSSTASSLSTIAEHSTPTSKRSLYPSLTEASSSSSSSSSPESMVTQ